ncbi:MAG: hypothetical protein PHG20_05110 [Geobacteraceae bacterium]|nr:hypothetical protein [Geobacteraceae bacterium]
MEDLLTTEAYHKILELLIREKLLLRKELTHLVTNNAELWNSLPTELNSSVKENIYKMITDKSVDEIEYYLGVLDQQFEVLCKNHDISISSKEKVENLLYTIKRTEIESGKLKHEIEELNNRLREKEKKLHDAEDVIFTLNNKLSGTICSKKESKHIKQITELSQKIEELNIELNKCQENAKTAYKNRDSLQERVLEYRNNVTIVIGIAEEAINARWPCTKNDIKIMRDKLKEVC